MESKLISGSEETSCVRPPKIPAVLPVTFDDWECTLVPYFLGIGSDGDDSPIQAIEITRRTLALACSVSFDQENEVESAFRQILSNDPFLKTSLRYGSSRRPQLKIPNCFTYLAFTLLIDSLGEAAKYGEFRLKLMSWLGVTTTFPNLRGVALMWESLVTWLDARIGEGEPYRRLILPDQGSWRHIGYTRRLSFPNKSDRKLVANFCRNYVQHKPIPHVILEQFPRQLNDQTSWGLHRAFNEFRNAYYLQRRALQDLPFWRLIESSVGQNERICHNSTIEMIFNGKSLVFTAEIIDQQSFGPVESLSEALFLAKVERSKNLAVSAATGIIYFRCVSPGRWRAEQNPNDSVLGLHVAIAERHSTKLGSNLEGLISSDGWHITTEPRSLKSIEDTLQQLKLISIPRSGITRPYLSGGIRTGGVWLGRPRFLPAIDSDTLDCVVRKVSLDGTNPKLELSIEGGRLNAPQPIEGAYTIHPKLLSSEEQVPWSLRVRFSKNAVVHGTYSCANAKLPLLLDWKRGAPTKLSIEFMAFTWEEHEPACADVLEAIYASGRSGWEEAELIAILRSADDHINPWFLLRAIADAGVAKPHLRVGWKGRVWTLNEPTIIQARYGEKEIAIVEGALCNQLLDDFKLAVRGYGGTAFRRLGVTDWAVPIIGAVNVPARALAERLGWRYASEIESPAADALETNHQALHYTVAANWCWHSRRFISRQAHHSSIRLTRLVHNGGRDHDIYKIESKGRSFHYLSRTTAIALAHSISQVPLFEWHANEEILSLKASDGGLPDAIAMELRRLMLRNGGPGDASYYYPANEQTIHQLNHRLPGCIKGIDSLSVENNFDAVNQALRSLHQLRPHWIDGKITLNKIR